MHDHCGASKDRGRSSSRLPIELPKRAARTGVLSPSNSPRSLAADVWERQNTNSLQGLGPRAMNTTRESHDSPDPPLGSRRVPRPPSHANNKNAESRAHHPISRPPRRRPELSGALCINPMEARARPGGCDAQTKKNRAGERRDHRLTAHSSISWQLRDNDKTPPAVRAVRIVRRRRDVVLRHEGLEHLRLRRPQTQTLQSQEHGRSENSTRGLPCHLLNVLIPYPLSQVTRRHHRKLIGATPGQQLQEPLVHGVLELDEAPVLAQRAGDRRRRGHRQRQPRGPDDLAQREGHGQRRRAV